MYTYVVMSKRSRDGDVQGERKSSAPRRNRMTTRLKERKRPAEEASQNPRSKTRLKTECTQEQEKPPTMSEREKRALAAERRALVAKYQTVVAEDHIAASEPTKIFDARVRWLHKEQKRNEDLRKRQKHIEVCRKRARAYEERIKHQKAIDNLRDLLGGMTISNPPKTKHDNTPLRF